jgi:hypothetical protein
MPQPDAGVSSIFSARRDRVLAFRFIAAIRNLQLTLHVNKDSE